MMGSSEQRPGPHRRIEVGLFNDSGSTLAREAAPWLDAGLCGT